MALPLLDSMAPGRSVAAAASPVRLGYVYTPNGIIGACDKSPRPFMWTPKTTGANFEFSPTMKALEPYRDQLNAFSGLAQVTGRALGDGPGDHARAGANTRAPNGEDKKESPDEFCYVFVHVARFIR